MPVPTFVCIGAQRSGTTWLDAQLRLHPQIWMPPVKELHFLNARFVYPPITPRIGKKGSSYQLMMDKRVRYALSHLREPHNIAWVMRYLFSPRLVRCYPWMFMPAKEQICGEVTPGYARMPSKKIRALHSIAPDMKMIYLIRDPVARIWANVSLMAAKKPTLIDYANDWALHNHVVKTFFYYTQNTEYMQNLARWEACYPPEQFFFGFFEQVAEEPGTLLCDIYRFLGVDDSSRHVPATVRIRRNASNFRGIPPQTEHWITERMMPQYVGLHERFANSYTANWLQRAEAVLARGTIG